MSWQTRNDRMNPTKPKPVPEFCTCVKGTSKWVYIDAMTQRCRRCGAVRRKVQ